MTSLYVFGSFDTIGSAHPLNLTISSEALNESFYRLSAIFEGVSANISKLHFSMIIFDQ